MVIGIPSGWDCGLVLFRFIGCLLIYHLLRCFFFLFFFFFPCSSPSFWFVFDVARELRPSLMVEPCSTWNRTKETNGERLAARRTIPLFYLFFFFTLLFRFIFSGFFFYYFGLVLHRCIFFFCCCRALHGRYCTSIQRLDTGPVIALTIEYRPG